MFNIRFITLQHVQSLLHIMGPNFLYGSEDFNKIIRGLSLLYRNCSVHLSHMLNSVKMFKKIKVIITFSKEHPQRGHKCSVSMF